jgi:hypothetical protein
MARPPGPRAVRQQISHKPGRGAVEGHSAQENRHRDYARRVGLTRVLPNAQLLRGRSEKGFLPKHNLRHYRRGRPRSPPNTG